MKKIFTFFIVLCFTETMANAQKGTPTAVTPHNTIRSILPDLTFDLFPVIHGGEHGYVDIPGTKGHKKVTISFIVKNIGLGNAVPSQVYAEYIFNVTDARPFIRSAQSNTVSIPAIEKGKDLLVENRDFIFTNTPVEAYGKELKFRLVIVATGTGSQQEHSTKNNASVEIPFKISR